MLTDDILSTTGMCHLTRMMWYMHVVFVNVAVICH